MVPVQQLSGFVITVGKHNDLLGALEKKPGLLQRTLLNAVSLIGHFTSGKHIVRDFWGVRRGRNSRSSFLRNTNTVPQGLFNSCQDFAQLLASPIIG
jgi:hypothetical protein